MISSPAHSAYLWKGSLVSQNMCPFQLGPSLGWSDLGQAQHGQCQGGQGQEGRAAGRDVHGGGCRVAVGWPLQRSQGGDLGAPRVGGESPDTNSPADFLWLASAQRASAVHERNGPPDCGVPETTSARRKGSELNVSKGQKGVDSLRWAQQKKRPYGRLCISVTALAQLLRALRVAAPAPSRASATSASEPGSGTPVGGGGGNTLPLRTWK